MSDALRDWEAVLGVIDGGRQHLLETQLAEALEGLLPTPGSARHCNRQDAVARHAGAGAEIRGVGAIAERVEMVERGAARRHAARVQGVELVLLGDVDDGEEIAREAGIHRLNYIERGRGRHRSVDGIAALHQDLEAGLRGERPRWIQRWLGEVIDPSVSVPIEKPQ